MRKLMLIAVLAAGCADGTTLSMDAPDPGMAHDGSAGGGGTSGAGGSGPACDAAVETLNGTAMYVAGSAVAGDPDTQTSFGRCGDLVAGQDWDAVYAQPIQVTAGKIGNYAAAIVSGARSSAGCTYALRLTTPAPPANCLVTRDYLLVAP